MESLISIIIPVYNVQNYIEECIRSILKQTYINFELILINDGSIDNCLEICLNYKKKDNRIIVINQDNHGVASARNKGLEIAKGEYIVFVDGDDYVEKNYLEKLMNNQKNVDMSICSYYEYYKNIRVTHLSCLNDIVLNKNDAIRNLFKREYYGGYLWNKLFKKEILDLYNIKFNNNIDMCEDLLFVVKYISKINKINVITDSLYNYRMRKSSIVWNRNTKKYNTIWKAYNEIEEILKSNEIELIEFKYSILTTYFIQNSNNNEIDIKKIYIEVINSDLISKKKKIKLFILKNFVILYNVYLNIKKNKYELFE